MAIALPPHPASLLVFCGLASGGMVAIALPPYPASRACFLQSLENFNQLYIPHHPRTSHTTPVHPTPPPHILLTFFMYVIHLAFLVGSKAEVWWRSPCHHTPPLCLFSVGSQAEVWWRTPCHHTPPQGRASFSHWKISIGCTSHTTPVHPTLLSKVNPKNQ